MYFLLYVFVVVVVVNGFLLSVCFIFTLDCENDVRQKQILVIFLSEFKMGKAAKRVHNINNALGPGTANEHIVQTWFKKLCPGDEALQMKSTCWPSGVDNKRWAAAFQAGPLRTTREVAKSSAPAFLGTFGICPKLER